MPILLVLLLSTIAWSQDLRTILGGQDVFIPKLGSKEKLTSHARFNGFIQGAFNRPGDFHGLNCYSTALLASGTYAPKRRRYVSPEEFEAVLKTSFVNVTDPRYQDIVVFDAKSTRGHAAFYLGDDLVFHKKSYGTHYHYRVTQIEAVGVVEENEWRPGPVDDSSLQMNWPALGSLPKEFYRMKSDLPLLDKKFGRLIQSMEAALVEDLGKWAIGRRWGLSGEYFLEDFVKLAQEEKLNKYTQGVLTSLKDQVYIMLEEVHYKSARSTSKVNEEICFPEEGKQLEGFIHDLGLILGRDKAKVQEAIKKLRTQDLSRCLLRPMNLL